jgi:hypothetical protein
MKIVDTSRYYVRLLKAMLLIERCPVIFSLVKIPESVFELGLFSGLRIPK